MSQDRTQREEAGHLVMGILERVPARYVDTVGDGATTRGWVSFDKLDNSP